MKFSEALKLMKQGAKVKLPGWNGYWCWDDEKQTIMIHCRPKIPIKARSSSRYP